MWRQPADRRRVSATRAGGSGSHRTNSVQCQEWRIDLDHQRRAYLQIEGSPLEERKRDSLAPLALSSVSVGIDDSIVDGARHLESAGCDGFDALHLASGEAGGAEVLLTTDDKFVKRAYRGDGSPRVSVRNPVSRLKDRPL